MIQTKQRLTNIPTTSRIGTPEQISGINTTIGNINRVLNEGIETGGASTPNPNDATDTTARNSGLYQQELERGLITEKVKTDITRQADELAAQRRQAQIDTINAMYAPRIDREAEEAEGRTLRAKAMALRTGNVGAGTEDPYRAGTRKSNEASMRSLEDERAAKIQDALYNIDQLRVQEIERLTKEKKETAESNLTLLQGQITQAENQIKALGSGGVTLEKLKSVDTKAYETLRDVAGLSDFEIASRLAANNPALNAKLEYKDGVVTSYYTDPTTGKPVVNFEKVDGLSDQEEFQSIDGVAYAFKKDANGNYSAGRPLTQKQYKPTSGEVKLTNSQKQKLVGAGISLGEIANVEADVNSYGIDQAVEGLPVGQQQAIRDIYGLPKSSGGGSLF